MNIKKNLKSVNTTIAGIIAGLMIILPQLANLFDGDPETTLSETILISGIAIMFGGFAAKDGDKSTEDVS